MNGRYLGAVVGVIVVAVVGGALFMATRPAKPMDSTRPTSPAGNVGVQDPAPKSPASDGPAPKTNVASADTAGAKPKNPDVAQDPTLFEEDLLDDDTVKRLHDRFGSYGELYKAISPAQREELVDWLDGEELLRTHLGEILPIERDSDLRAFMLRRVEPKGTWEGDEHANDEDYVDTELIALLDKPTDTPIKSEEWQARTDLAVLTDYEYALSWTREAKRAHPDDLSVGLQAASSTMIIGASIEGVGPTETQDAEKYLRESLSGEQAAKLSSDEKKKGYYGLYWSADKEATRDWFRSQLAKENDPQARLTLENLLARLERNLARTQ